MKIRFTLGWTDLVPGYRKSKPAAKLGRRMQTFKPTVSVAFVLAFALWVSAAHGQQVGSVRRVGFLNAGGGPSGAYDVLRQSLRVFGHTEGGNIEFDYRSTNDRARLAEMAKELVGLKVDVIVAEGGAAASAAKSVTNEIPIVFGHSGDPVEAGLVASIARPGGNMTGMTFLAYELLGKRLELLKEVVPKVSRVAVLSNPAHPGEQREWKETQGVARSLKINILYHQVKTLSDFDAAFDASVKAKANGLLVFPEAFTLLHVRRIAEFAVKRKLPAIFGWSEYVDAGGLMSYGPNRNQSYKRIAAMVDKVLKGTKPVEIPVELPLKWELVFNLNAAKQIGLTVPPNVLVRADRVIR